MKNTKNVYDNGNIPETDLPKDAQDALSGILDVADQALRITDQFSHYCTNRTENAVEPVEPLPESSRPRKDGPGGN